MLGEECEDCGSFKVYTYTDRDGNELKYCWGCGNENVKATTRLYAL